MGSGEPVAVFRSPNHGGPRPGTKGVILHATRSQRCAPEDEYQATVDYMMQPGTVSAHRVIGVLEGQHAQLVADDLQAWHAEEDNLWWLSIEFCQPTAADSFSDYQIKTGVAVVAAWLRHYGLAPATETIRRHEDTEQGKRWGKTDPGACFPYAEFIAMLNAER